MLDAGLGQRGGIVRADSGLRLGNGGVPAGLGLVECLGVSLGDGLVERFLRLLAERAVQKVERDERIARVAARGDGIADEHEGEQDKGKQEGAFFHIGSFTPWRIAY